MKNYLFSILFLAGTAATAQIQTEYYSTGKKRCEGAYVPSSGSGTKVIMASDGSSRPDPSQTKTGNWTYWYEAGTKSAEESYAAGNSTGVWKTWYPDGTQSSEINYTAGTAVFWFPNGNKQSEGGILQNRVFNGSWTAWYDNGVKSYDGNYKNGKKDGDWKWYDTSGKQTLVENYSQDVLKDSKK